LAIEDTSTPHCSTSTLKGTVKGQSTTRTGTLFWYTQYDQLTDWCVWRSSTQLLKCYVFII